MEVHRRASILCGPRRRQHPRFWAVPEHGHPWSPSGTREVSKQDPETFCCVIYWVKFLCHSSLHSRPAFHFKMLAVKLLAL